MAARKITLTDTLACSCFGSTTYDLRGWNAVGKPLVECRKCDETVTAPIAAMESDPHVRQRRRARLATDGGDAR
jgi:hypothetical protein